MPIQQADGQSAASLYGLRFSHLPLLPEAAVTARIQPPPRPILPVDSRLRSAIATYPVGRSSEKRLDLLDLPLRVAQQRQFVPVELFLQPKVSLWADLIVAAKVLQLRALR
jgi:hypothetical protein